MTGPEFEAAVRAAGFNQAGFAKVMGVHRNTIAERFAAAEVEPHWVFALAGVIAARAVSPISALVGNFDVEPAKMSK